MTVPYNTEISLGTKSIGSNCIKFGYRGVVTMQSFSIMLLTTFET